MTKSFVNIELGAGPLEPIKSPAAVVRFPWREYSLARITALFVRRDVPIIE
jgi:hypothetical protein